MNRLNRRVFLARGVASVTALGTGVVIGNHLFADRTEIAARVDQTPESHPLVPALQMGTRCLQVLDSVQDYTATFIKRELIGRRLMETKLALKLREEPFSVYLKFLDPNAGREVIFVEGQHNNMLQVHDVGFARLAGTLSLDPKGSYAMDGNRHPVTSIGMRFLAAALLEQWLDETKYDDLSVNFYPKAKIGSTSCNAIECSHSNPRAGAKFQLTRLYVDAETHYPIRVQQYEFAKRPGGQPVLVEDYLYSDLKVNVGLTAMDFSTRNPKYGY